MWNEAWDQRLEPDRIEVSQPDRLDSNAIIKKNATAIRENRVVEITAI